MFGCTPGCMIGGIYIHLQLVTQLTLRFTIPMENTTEGLAPQHIDMWKPMFVFAPDTKIKTHPV